MKQIATVVASCAVGFIVAMLIFSGQKQDEMKSEKPPKAETSQAQQESQKDETKQDEAKADGTSPFKSEEEILSYMMGTDIANNLKRQPVDIEVDMVAMGLRDIFEGKDSKLTPEDENKGREFYQDIMRERHTKQMQEKAKEAEKAKVNKEKGKEFLAENAKNDGVKTTDSGMQYTIIKEGTGESPKATDMVSVHYHGTLIDGTVFDSSVERGKPAEFPVNGVIRGWQEALPMMKVGGKRKLFIPSDLAYGDRAAGPKIPSGSTLIFEVELLKILGPAANAPTNRGHGDHDGHAH